ncbi:hypothetical protein [Thalassotalea crassostreae]|uniref:hypothetical protein n=1 Tax=Thalassotalea crassostreae TaxID=1763536 RepID=UPI000837CF57|nr:hypothetical protein [Thalassotalea crassostreae]
MMKGIIPIQLVSRPSKLSLGFILERAEQRKIASNCKRCGGSGKFSTVPSAAIGSRFGGHCFDCGDAWKLPVEWNRLDLNGKASLFKHIVCAESIKSIIDTLVRTKILSLKESYNLKTVLLSNAKVVSSSITVERVNLFLEMHGVRLAYSDVQMIQKKIALLPDGVAKSKLKLLILTYKQSGLLAFSLLE